MATKHYKPYQNKIRRLTLFKEKALIQKYFNGFKCIVMDDSLICTGIIQPTDFSLKYKIKIIYETYDNPKVYIKDPKIPYNKEIHMYEDTRLCLYFPEDNSWNWTMNLHETIIPWTAEWLIFYELYQITGNWEHPAVSHTGTKIE